MEIQIDLLYTIDQIDSLFTELLSDDFANAYVPYYDAWRSQTREGLLLGRKLAIGAWTVPDEYAGKREDLVGVCILKKSDSLVEPELVLEVIYVARKYRNPHYYQGSEGVIWDGPRQAIGSSLLKRAEKLSQKYGYCRVVSEVSTLHSDLVFFLLRQQFVVIGYDGNTNQYRLVKRIEPVYNKDPYDVTMIVEWLCYQWNISKTKWVDQDHITGTLTIGKQTSWEVEVHILVCLDAADLQRKVRKAGRGMCFVLFKTEEDQIAGTLKDQMYFLQPTGLKRETRSPDVDLTLQDYAAAVVVSIRRELFDHFKPSEHQAFLDGAEYGHVLMKRSGGHRNRHVFIVFSDSDSNNQEILGVGRVLSVHTKTPDEMWEQFGAMSTFAQKEEFNRYSNIKNRMTAIVFDQLEVNTERIDLSQALAARGWYYMTDEQFYRQVLSRGDYPQAHKLVKG